MNKDRIFAVAMAGLAAASIVVVGGCEGSRGIFGLAKTSPDEFAVVTRAPLVMPPDYGLRPPTPGAPRPQERDIKDEARRILLSSNLGAIAPAAGGSAQAASAGELALLNKAGAQDADASIREMVSRESAIMAVSKNGFVERLMFWRKPGPPGAVLDAGKERKRLRENAALGDFTTKGETPTIERKKKGFLEGLLN